MTSSLDYAPLLLLSTSISPFVSLVELKAHTDFLGLSPRQDGGTSSNQGCPFIFQSVTVLWYGYGSKLSECNRTPLYFLPDPLLKGLRRRDWVKLLYRYSRRFFEDVSVEFQYKFRLSCSPTTLSAARNPQWSFIDSAAPYGGPLNWSWWQTTGATARFTLVDFLCVTVTSRKSVFYNWRMPHSTQSDWFSHYLSIF